MPQLGFYLTDLMGAVTNCNGSGMGLDALHGEIQPSARKVHRAANPIWKLVLPTF